MSTRGSEFENTILFPHTVPEHDPKHLQSIQHPDVLPRANDEAGVRATQLQDFSTAQCASVTMETVDPRQSAGRSHGDSDAGDLVSIDSTLVFPQSVDQVVQRDFGTRDSEMAQIRMEIETLRRENERLQSQIAAISSKEAQHGTNEKALTLNENTAMCLGDVTVEDQQPESSFEPPEKGSTARERQLQAWGTPVSENAFGAFIHVTMKEGVLAALQKVAMWVLFSWALQGVFALQLAFSLDWPPSQLVHFCDVPSSLQLCSVATFLLFMINNIPQMYKHYLIALFCAFPEEEKDDDGRLLDPDAVPFKRYGTLDRACMFFFAVVLELVAWFSVLWVGVWFILSADSTALVVRTTVAVLFVQNIDEIVFSACCPKPVLASLQDTKYIARPVFISESSLKWLFTVYLHYVHLIFISALTLSVVYGARATAGCDGVGNNGFRGD